MYDYRPDTVYERARLPSLSPEANRLVRLATWASVLAASVMSMARAIAWQATESLAMLGALLDSLLDAACSVMIFVAVRYAITPADSEHRFGHGKAEAVAALFQGGMMSAASLFLLWNASASLLRPQPLESLSYGYAAVVLSVIVTFALVAFQRYTVRRTGSLAIESDSLHYRADLFLHISTFAALVGGGYYAVSWLDPLFATLIACYIGWEAWRVAGRALAQLMDKELSEEDRAAIREIAESHPEVRGVHDLRTRLSGRQALVQLHIELQPDMKLLEAHRISDEVEERIRVMLPDADIIIHQDPEGYENLTALESS